MSIGQERYRKFIIESISLYQSLPALWDVKSKEYRDKQMKNKSYDTMVEKFRQIYPDATRETVKKKFNILRTNYRKELKKIEASGGNYTTNLWYFHELSFLNCGDTYEYDMADSMKEEVDSNIPVHFTTRASPRLEDVKKKFDREDFLPPCRVQSPAVPETSRGPFDCSEFQAVGFNISAKLQKMSTEQQIYAELLLNKVLTRGLLGTLTAKTDLTDS